MGRRGSKSGGAFFLTPGVNMEWGVPFNLYRVETNNNMMRAPEKELQHGASGS